MKMIFIINQWFIFTMFVSTRELIDLVTGKTRMFIRNKRAIDTFFHYSKFLFMETYLGTNKMSLESIQALYINETYWSALAELVNLQKNVRLRFFGGMTQHRLLMGKISVAYLSIFINR